jgi:hypothetical protein
MRPKAKLDELLKDPEYRRVFQQEKLILEVTEAVCRVMDETRTSRSVLAKLLGRTKGYITQLLSGRRNLTLRTWADMMTALGHEARVTVQPLTYQVTFTITPETEGDVPQRWLPSANTTTVDDAGCNRSSTVDFAA